MEPVEFVGQNIVFAKDQPEYIPLPALVLNGQAISCWKLTPEELAEVAKTGIIWCSQVTFGGPLQPQRLSVDRPFTIMEEH